MASERKITALIDAKIRKRFLDKKIMYVRNYGEGVDLSWQDAFQTHNKLQVEAYCSRFGMGCEWRNGNRLRTRAVRQVMIRHPETTESLWFNHVPLFHMSNLTLEVREGLLSHFEPDELPRNAFYGDGSFIEEDIIDEIRQVYQNHAVRFQWRVGDVLMLDNFLSAHGRDPFAGSRRILVAMAQPHSSGDMTGNEPQLAQPIDNNKLENF